MTNNLSPARLLIAIAIGVLVWIDQFAAHLNSYCRENQTQFYTSNRTLLKSVMKIKSNTFSYSLLPHAQQQGRSGDIKDRSISLHRHRERKSFTG